MHFTEISENIRDGLLSLFLPQTCRSCGRYIKNFKMYCVCGSCLEKVTEIKEPVCAVCGKPLSSDAKECIECRKRRNYFEFCRPAGIFEGALKDTVYALKFDGRKKAARVIAEMIAERTDIHSLEKEFILVPVPGNSASERERGFCHTWEIARVLSKISGHSVRRMVRKVRDTEPQNRLEKKKRLTNLKNAFLADSSVKGKKIAIIDDVFTTGSTVNETAKALKKEGADRVIGIVAARSV